MLFEEEICHDCTLYKDCRSIDLQPYGSSTPDIYILGEFPSDREDLVGKYSLSGKPIYLIMSILEHFGIKQDKVRYYNSVNCKPKKDEIPSDIQINSCRNKIIKDIKESKPKVIIACGNSSLKSLFEQSEPGINGWRGWQIPSHDLSCWVVPVVNPQRVIDDGIPEDEKLWVKQTNYTDSLKVLREDLSIVPDLLKAVVPKNKSYEIKKLLKFNEVINFFDNIVVKYDKFTIDFETKGLKPYFSDSVILSIAITFDGNTSYAFPVSYSSYFSNVKYWNENQESEILKRLKLLLSKEGITKVIHNLIFETEWSLAILNIWLNDIEDTMLQKYILDCRTGTMNLDFLAFATFGVRWKKYPDSIMSDLRQLSIVELLEYNGTDTIFEHRLYNIQSKYLDKDKVLQDRYYEQIETARSIAKIQFMGACTNEQSRENLLKDFKEKRVSIEKEIFELVSVKTFESKFGRLPSLKSNSKDVSVILFDIENLSSYKKTKKGNVAVDKEVLNKFAEKGSLFCDLLPQYREYSGAESKMLKSYTDCVFPDGKYHTSFRFVETGRLGCIAKGTKIQVVCDRSKFPEGKNIEDIKEGDLVYTFDENMNLKLKKVLNSCKTGDREIIRIHWRSNGSKKIGFLDLTPEHKVRVLSGEYIQAKDLKVMDRVLATNISSKLGYGIIYATRHTEIKEHRFIYKECVQEIDDRGIFGDIIHHINGNRMDNRIENLQKLKNVEHIKLHSIGHIVSKESISKQIETRKKNELAGLIKHKYGEDNSSYIHLSKFSLLKLIAKAGGKPTKIDKFCYMTIITKFKEFEINYKNIYKRYGEDGKYISRGKLKKLIDKGLFHKDIYVILNIGYFRLNELIEYYNLNYIKRDKWGNKYNHYITKIEFLNEIVPVYDIEVEDTHNFIANEICVHNSRDINLQNLDKRKHPEVRQLICAPPGHVLIIYDFAQLEARILAAVTNSTPFINHIINGYDIHLGKAIEIYGEDVIKNADKKLLKLLRFNAKNGFVFPTFYGSKPKATAGRLGITESHAQALYDKLWIDYPEIKVWQNEILKFYDKKRYVEIPPGRRRYAPLTINQRLNTPIQGASSSIVCKAMNTLVKRDYWVYLNCHDEIISCVPEKEAKYASEEMKEVMTSKQFDFMGRVPLEVEGTIGDNWFQTVAVNEIFE